MQTSLWTTSLPVHGFGPARVLLVEINHLLGHTLGPSTRRKSQVRAWTEGPQHPHIQAWQPSWHAESAHGFPEIGIVQACTARGAPAQAGMPSVPQRLQAPSQQVRMVSSRQVPPLGSLSGMLQHGHSRSPQPTKPGVGSTSAFEGGVGAGGGLGSGVPRGKPGAPRAARALRAGGPGLAGRRRRRWGGGLAAVKGAEASDWNDVLASAWYGPCMHTQRFQSKASGEGLR